MMSHIYTRVQAKARARQLKTESAEPLTLAAALERVAQEMGFRDWNTASARLSNAPEAAWQIGERVAGRYLKQAFTGRIHGVRELQGGSGYELVLHFDTPVDVVDWESFSALRQRVKAHVSPEGVSWTKTSDGVPHLVVARGNCFGGLAAGVTRSSSGLQPPQPDYPFALILSLSKDEGEFGGANFP